MTWRCSAAPLSQRADLVFDPFDGIAGARGGKSTKAAAAVGFDEGNVRAPGGGGQTGTSGADLREDHPADGAEDEEEEEEEEEEAPAAHIAARFDVLCGVKAVQWGCVWYRRVWLWVRMHGDDFLQHEVRQKGETVKKYSIYPLNGF